MALTFEDNEDEKSQANRLQQHQKIKTQTDKLEQKQPSNYDDFDEPQDESETEEDNEINNMSAEQQMQGRLNTSML